MRFVSRFVNAPGWIKWLVDNAPGWIYWLWSYAPGQIKFLVDNVSVY